MENEQLIPIEQLCVHYNIEYSFIQSLTEFGLLEITTVEETQYLSSEHLREVEKMIRLHYELDINIEGLEAISHLLQKVDRLQDEVMLLKNRLRQYDQEENL